MEQKKDCISKQDAKPENNVSRAQSQDALDSSSASSLSFLADHSDIQNSCFHENEKSTDDQKSGECSPRPPMDEALKSEKAFIEFVMSLPPKESPDHNLAPVESVSPKPKVLTPANTTTKVGLDHLDNLCKLMEQLSELRETNNKLQRRVQYLEDLKTLHDMHKEISDETQYSSEDALTGSNKPRPYELQKSATETCCPKKEDLRIVTSTRSHSRYQSRRGRSQSTDGQRRERSKSVGHEDTGEDTKSKRLFPKWSKVKEAFGWESDRKDSVKMKTDEESLRTPRRCSDDSHQSYHPPKSPTWSQNYPSLHSSLEDVHEILDSGRWKRSSMVSEKNAVYLEAPKDVLRRQKSTPSPGSEKLIPHREVSDLKPKSSTIERDTYCHQDFGKEDCKRGKSPWGRVKTIIERRRDSLKRRSLRREHECDPTHKKMPEVAEVKSYAEYVESSVRQPVVSDLQQHRAQHQHHHKIPDAIVIDEEIDYGALTRTPSSSPTFHRKSRWTRVKKALKGKKEDERDPSLSTPASPNSGQDGHFTFDVIEEITQDSYDDGREIKRVGSDSHVHQLSLSAPTCDLMLQLQRNLSEDFHKKIMEWERIRSSGNASCSPHWDRKSSLTVRSRKKSERDEQKSIKPKVKDLTWLEKELQKIEKEKQRLSKEKQKYEERALRLEKLKETVLSAEGSNKREVFVRTSAGEFRFEGISDAFTKKLYEWETKRGLGPELSTIALLDSSRLTVQPGMNSKSAPLQRVVSRSESSIADIGQPSHNSSNSLPSLKMPDPMDTIQPSRANSEPDLSTLVALTTGNNGSVTNLSRQVGDSMDDEITTSPGVSRESEEDELEKKRNDSETYYGLLEENVILLEQLKDKEEICSRLENELEVLDKKVDVMNKHHTQETERYREKLWEMHKPGATPRDVQCCLRTMSQLRKRIEVLEKCTEKLRNDRESVEDSFRYHSKQQEDMTLDLLQKMSELQAAGSSTTECENQGYIPPPMDASAVERLQDLSVLLVKQTEELQETLSAKTRQICQLRWELLHRDLSTVKLETELHTHTAHRKRSKYAHYRSHSSEDAPAVPSPQELDCSKSALITEAYYNVNPESDFQATQLTNTVQQLKREVLKLANATEYPVADYSISQACQGKMNKEGSWAKISSQSKNKDKAKQITVRRSSADNLSAMFKRDEGWKQNHGSSSDSDDSSDGYTRVSFHSTARNNHFLNPNAERLLMSSDEHPPRGYLQRKKKLQKISKGNASGPNRKRSHTFHNKRDFEKPTVCDNLPQKFHSFRLPTERNFSYSVLKHKSDTANIRNLLGEVRYQELLQKKAQTDSSTNKKMSFIVNNSSKMIPDGGEDNQWLREVASDSKIPLLFQLQYRTDENFPNSLSTKCPVRSFSDKRGKEMAAERRESYQRKKNRRHLTSPDLLSNLSETLKARILADSSSQQKTPRKDKPDNTFNGNVKISSVKKQQCPEKVSFASDIPLSSTDSTTVTVQLPKKKTRKTQQKTTEEKSEKGEETFNVVINKKRSLSSEEECKNFNSYNLNLPEKTKDTPSYETYENLNVCSFTDSNLYREDNPMMKTRDCADSQVLEFARDGPQSEQMSRKRKAEDVDPFAKGSSELDSAGAKHQTHNESKNGHSDILSTSTESAPNRTGPNYVKSSSATHLDWKKMCAKKVSREGASNVKSLIEKYNKVAEGHMTTTSANSSNLNSPTCNRKISAPVYNSRSEHSIPSQHSFSTPTTPSIIPASAFYNPLVFRPINLDLFPRSAPESPLSAARTEAIKKAKEQFIASQNTPTNYSGNSETLNIRSVTSPKTNEEKVIPENHLTIPTRTDNETRKQPDDDRISNCSMDSSSLVMFRTGESCQESRFSKRSVDYSRQDSDTLDRRNNLKTSKSLSNSSIFKSVLNSDFKIPSTLLKLKRSKRKKDMVTVSQLCRQSLLLTTEDTVKLPSPPSHKSCPSSPELKNKSEVKPGWFHRNILRHK